MKKFPFFLAAALVAFASCTNDQYAGGDDIPGNKTLAINFLGGNKSMTRADATGADAAALLGNSFRVYGTVTDASNVMTPVFDNYVVDYVGTPDPNIPDSTNVAGWSYYGQTSLGLAPANQNVKYWDLSAPQYDFVAFSGLDDDMRVISTTSNTIPVNQTNKDKIFVSDHVTAKWQASATGKTANAQYGKTITLTFKRLAARVRFGIYETVPGYAVKDVKFYYDDNYLAQAGTSTKTVAGLRGTFPLSGNVIVTYDENNSVLADFEGTDVANSIQFGELDYTYAVSSLVSGGNLKENGTIDATGDPKFLSTTSAKPTFAIEAGNDWKTVLPYASNKQNLVLRADFTLVSLDGVGAPINVKGASAVVPVGYAQWKPNYAYTYIFKISDKTNGTTDPNPNPNPQDPDTPNPNPNPGVDPGLYPITFDAVVSNIEDYNQETITGVTSLGGDAITTYSKTSDVTNAGEYKVGETIIVSSISHGQWKVAYSATEPTEQGVADSNTFTYDTLAGAAEGGKTIDECGTTFAQFKVEKAGYYVVWLRYLPTGLEDVEGYYVDVFKVVKTVE
ncbi:MAG: hypothetical protein J6W75_01015 [Bacteroidaceae bacterium]|nr:hypothetical protein [Bacteroidales bacterium]MBP5769930.1 hypothetical protein [Bacteroidaceae bacterium]